MNKRTALNMLEDAILYADALLPYARDPVYIGSQHWSITHLLQTSAYFPSERDAASWGADVLKHLDGKTDRVKVSELIKLTSVDRYGEVHERYLVLVSLWFPT